MVAPALEGAAVTALRAVLHRVRQAAEKSGRRADDVRVVAVSKTKPISLIHQVYDAGYRCFGENYVQEIIDKAPQVISLSLSLCIYTRRSSKHDAGANLVMQKMKREKYYLILVNLQGNLGCQSRKDRRKEFGWHFFPFLSWQFKGSLDK